MRGTTGPRFPRLQSFAIESGKVKKVVSMETKEDALWEFLIEVRNKGWRGQLGQVIRVSMSEKPTDRFLYPSALALWATHQIGWDEACKETRIDPFSGHVFSLEHAERLMKIGMQHPWVQVFRKKTEEQAQA